MDIQVDFRSKKPLVTQIRQAVAAQIETGRLQPDEALPTVRQLAEQLQVNFNTVARAYRELDKFGLVTTRQGRGTVVVGPTGQDNSDESGAENQTAQAFARSTLENATQLGIDPVALAQWLMILSGSQKQCKPKRIRKYSALRRKVRNKVFKPDPPNSRTKKSSKRKPI